jgi:hypothetical protein
MGFFRSVGNFLTFGALDKKDAKNIVNESKEREEDAKNRLEKQRIKTQEQLEELGKIKISAFNKTLLTFQEKFSRINKIDISPIRSISTALENRNYSLEIAQIQKRKTTMKELAIAAGGMAVAGTATAGITFAAISLFGTASTGTAIGSLSGVAATNATLAWIGGGSIASGGAGVVGGTLVLGGIALAPVAIIGMFFGVQSGKQRLNEAKEYEATIDLLVERVNSLIQELLILENAAKTFNKTISSVDKISNYFNNQLDPILERLETRSVFSKIIDFVKNRFLHKPILLQSELISLENALNTSMLLKALIDKPIMDENGSFISDSLNIIKQSDEFINNNKQLFLSYQKG